eukprot:TRINITY_DN386_c1_g1_i2.p1 TRINITY_DN386_c1_g1~~TRINITY_DN386_c1_g1_i2.p1  ORF type:complete len:485 (-),score=255.23 TRINITY_DN386_c1_g1_i2:808-2262(-)
MPPGDDFIMAEQQQKEEEQKKKLENELFGVTEDNEMDVGMLNMAAPQGFDPTIDTDVMAALDGYDDDLEELEDDFVLLAGGEANEEEMAEWPGVKKGRTLSEYEAEYGLGYLDYDSSADEDEGFVSSDDFGSDFGSYGGEEHEGGLHDPSMGFYDNVSYTSSRMHENDGGFREEQFETVMNKKYKDEDIGALDMDPRTMISAEESIPMTRLEDLLDEFEEENKHQKADLKAMMNENDDDDDDDDDNQQKQEQEGKGGDDNDEDDDDDEEDEEIPLLVPLKEETPEPVVHVTTADIQQTKTEQETTVLENTEEERMAVDMKNPNHLSNQEYEVIEIREKDDRWDVETYVSTLSTHENHPKLIDDIVPKKQKIKLDKRGFPMGVLEARRQQKKEEEEEQEEDDEEDYESGDDDDWSVATVNRGEKRDKNETAEEKRLRKKAVKAARKAKRQQKKELKTAFKQEELKQRKQKIGTASHKPGYSVIKF